MAPMKTKMKNDKEAPRIPIIGIKIIEDIRQAIEQATAKSLNAFSLLVICKRIPTGPVKALQIPASTIT